MAPFYGTPMPSRANQSPFQHPEAANSAPHPPRTASYPYQQHTPLRMSASNVSFAPGTTYNAMTSSRKNCTPMPSKRATMTPVSNVSFAPDTTYNTMTSSHKNCTPMPSKTKQSASNVSFAPGTTYSTMASSRKNCTPMPSKNPVMTRRSVSIDMEPPAYTAMVSASSSTTSYLVNSSSLSSLGKENSFSSSRMIASFPATPKKKGSHAGTGLVPPLPQHQQAVSAPFAAPTAAEPTTINPSSSTALFPVNKSGKKVKLTPPRPRAASKRTLGSTRRATSAKKSAKKKARKTKHSSAHPTPAAAESKDKFVIRTSEQDPSPFQVELPERDEILVHAKICNVMDKYMQIGGVSFDFNDLVNNGDDDTTSKECHAVMSALREVVPDIKVEGFFREYCDGERIEACILSSHSLRQFIVCYRGGTSVQSRPIRGQDKHVKLGGNDNDCVLHTKHPVAVMPSFRNAYFAGGLEENVFFVLNRLASNNPFCDVVMTGHSFGSAIATLGATRYASLCPHMRVACTVFGSPRVGGEDFCQFVHSLPNLRVVRVERSDDAYTCMPEGAKWRHAGHSISIVSTQAAAFPTALIESVVGAPVASEETEASTKIIAYKFDKGKPGPSNFLLQGVSELSRMVMPLGSYGKVAEIGSYIDEIRKAGGEKWVKEFAGLVGNGIKSGLDNERRLVV